MTTRVVLVVSAYSAFVDSFMDMAVQPVGVIELSPKKYNAAWLTRSKQCEGYCSKHGLLYANVAYANLSTLGQFFERWEADLVITYSIPILPMFTLSKPALGGINVHHSYLPAYRGGNPLLWQVIDEKETFGITAHKLSENVDQGDILGRVEVARQSGHSKKQLVFNSNRDYGVPLLHKVVTELVEGNSTPIKQPEQSTTDSANHIAPQELLSVLARKKVTLNGLWDVMCFYANLPSECLPAKGWQKWLRWKPSHIEHRKGVIPSCDGTQEYTVVPAGLRLHLLHSDGCLVFKLRWHAATFLSRLLP